MLNYLIVTVAGLTFMSIAMLFYRYAHERDVEETAEEILDLAQTLKSQTAGIVGIDKIRWELRRKHSFEGIASQIHRVRPDGEKPAHWIKNNVFYSSCEICGKNVRDNYIQCPLCGRWVGRERSHYNKEYNHPFCWSSSYGGVCGYCQDFIARAKRHFSTSTIYKAIQVLLEKYKNTLIWEVDTKNPIYSFTPRHITADEDKVLDLAVSQGGRLSREDLVRSPLNLDLEHAEQALRGLEKGGVATEKVIQGAHGSFRD